MRLVTEATEHVMRNECLIFVTYPRVSVPMFSCGVVSITQISNKSMRKPGWK